MWRPLGTCPVCPVLNPALWRDEFAWLTYEPAPADSDSNGAPAGAPAATGSASSDGTTTKPPTLDERKGLFLGETYRNEKACKYFIHSIANMEKDKVTAEMKDVKFITVVSDGSTDVSVSEKGNSVGPTFDAAGKELCERIFGDEANQDRRPEPIDGECPDRRAKDQADVSVDFRLQANRRNPCLACDRSSLTQTKTTNRIAALAVPLVMLVCVRLRVAG